VHQASCVRCCVLGVQCFYANMMHLKKKSKIWPCKSRKLWTKWIWILQIIHLLHLLHAPLTWWNLQSSKWVQILQIMNVLTNHFNYKCKVLMKYLYQLLMVVEHKRGEMVKSKSEKQTNWWNCIKYCFWHPNQTPLPTQLGIPKGHGFNIIKMCWIHGNFGHSRSMWSNGNKNMIQMEGNCTSGQCY
jgi:hypothetical protein